MPPYCLSHPQSHDQSKMVRAVLRILLSHPRFFATSMRNQEVSMQWPGLMVRPMQVSTNSPLGPTDSSSALNSGCMNCVRSFSIDSSIWRLMLGSSMTSSRREPTLMRIITMLWPCRSTAGSYLGVRKPGVSRKRCVSLNSLRAFSAYVLSPVASAYSDMAMVANVSLNT